MHKLRGHRDLLSYMDAGYLGNTQVVRVRLLPKVVLISLMRARRGLGLLLVSLKSPKEATLMMMSEPSSRGGSLRMIGERKLLFSYFFKSVSLIKNFLILCIS